MNARVGIQRFLDYLPATTILAGLFLTYYFHSFLLFHSLAEGFSVLVAGGIFMIAWHARRFLDNDYLLFVGIGYFSSASVDLIHTLAYKGTGIFPGYDANLPTQLWIAARCLQAGTLLIAPLYIRRKLRLGYAMSAFALVTAAVVWAVFTPGFFPDCWVEGKGMTPFKIAGEYVISSLFVAALWLLYRNRGEFDPLVLRSLLGSIVMSIGAEIAFTTYVNVYSQANVIGHLLKISSFYLIYKAIIETGLVKPYDLLFRNLKKSEEELRRDNEELTSLQRELAAKNEELRKLNDLKNHFVGMAAHDLRSPLSVISWYSEALLESPGTGGDETQRESLSIIRKSSEFMLNLVNNLLDISKIEAGKINLEKTPTDVASLISRNVHLNAILAERKHIRLNFNLGEKLAPVLVDPSRLEQVLNNLLSNAIKYSHPGTAVDVGLARENGYLLLWVKDEGQGIPAEELPRLFQPFQRTSVRGTAGEKSTGLGLAVVRQIVEAHGGSIRVESSVGKGSTFYVTLPAG